MGITVARKGQGRPKVGLPRDCSAWVLHFMQERFHNASPGNFESMFIKAGDSETKA